MINKALNKKPDGAICTLHLVMNQARNLNKIANDHLEDFNEYAAYKFSSLTHYLIALETIGSIFKLETKKELTNDRLQQCLDHFTELDDDQKKSVKNLRNSLAHNFSLGNNSEVFEINYFEEFDITPVEKQNIFFKQKRKGKDKNNKYNTKVSFDHLCTMVEGIYNNLDNYRNEGKLQINDEFIENPTHFNSVLFVK